MQDLNLHFLSHMGPRPQILNLYSCYMGIKKTPALSTPNLGPVSVPSAQFCHHLKLSSMGLCSLFFSDNDNFPIFSLSLTLYF